MIKILIVDDEPVKAQWIRDDCLLGYDCEIEIATSYLSAVGKLRDNKYHLVISDENLPDEENNVLGAGHVLKKYHLAEHPECRFILYTADPDLVENKDVKADCIAYGDHLKRAIHNAIYLMCQPKNREEEPQKISEMESRIMASEFNSKLCDERHNRLDKSIESLTNTLRTFQFLFIGAIVSSAFAIVVSCIKLVK